MPHPERHILERAVEKLSVEAAKVDALVDELLGAGVGGSDPLAIHTKQIRQELLSVKADVEGVLAKLILDCGQCGGTVHWVSGLGVTPGHWAHRTPSPHHEPVLRLDT